MCHNEFSPANTVFVDGRPTALFDFDMAVPGPRIRGVSYGVFLWLNLGTDGPPPEEQRRRIHVWCDACGLADRNTLIEEVKQRVRETVRRPRDVDDPSLGSLQGWRIAMRLVRSASEDEVIAAFLRAEIVSDGFGQSILAALEADHQPRAIVDSANLRDPQENRYRRELLGRARGWGRGKGMFQGFPAEVEWNLAAVTPKELAEVAHRRP